MSKEKWLNEMRTSESEGLPDQDKEIYDLIFEKIEKQWLPETPMHFSIEVSKREVARRNRLRDIKLYAFYAGLFLFLMAISLFSFSYSSIQIKWKDMAGIMSSCTAAALLYFTIETLDRLLVRKDE